VRIIEKYLGYVGILYVCVRSLESWGEKVKGV